MIQILGPTAAAGWVVPEGLGQFIERGLLSEPAYRIGLAGAPVGK